LFSRSYSVGAVTSKSSDTNSNLISFTLQGTDLERARRSLEAVLDAYLAAAAGLRKDAAEKARAAVVSHVEAARSRVIEAQAGLDAFLADPSGSGDAKATRDHAQAVELDRVVRLRNKNCSTSNIGCRRLKCTSI
jgi:hypothetical protein